jgi:DNA-binding transcriptional ArsR family regulator
MPSLPTEFPDEEEGITSIIANLRRHLAIVEEAGLVALRGVRRRRKADAMEADHRRRLELVQAELRRERELREAAIEEEVAAEAVDIRKFYLYVFSLGNL